MQNNKDDYQVLMLSFENETDLNFYECSEKYQEFKQIVNNFKSNKEDLFNTTELLIDYVNDKGEK
jgi:hypothetical protein|tara:strand:+ start:2879 stop:3073 length:195 start_codon:yes stop_codon:yes gene_type:complete